jgi:hypothetical protein
LQADLEEVHDVRPHIESAGSISFCGKEHNKMANHALFYPEWTISDPVFLAESLLYWDRLACIVPFSNFTPRPSHPDQEMQKVMTEAHETYVSPLVPTDEQKKRVHERVAAITEKDAPVWWQPGNLKPEYRQVVF